MFDLASQDSGTQVQDFIFLILTVTKHQQIHKSHPIVQHKRAFAQEFDCTGEKSSLMQELVY